MADNYNFEEVVGGEFDVNGEDITAVAEILARPEKIIIKTERTETPQDYTGPRITTKSKEEIPIEEMIAQAQFMPGPPPMRMPVAPPAMQPMNPQMAVAPQMQGPMQGRPPLPMMGPQFG